MSEHDPVIVASELVTGYGFGERLCWEGLLSGRHAFREIERFDASKMRSRLAATVPGLSAEHGGHSLLEPMLDFLRPYASKTYGRTELFLASTVGEIDLLETVEQDTLHSLLQKAQTVFRVGNGRVVSAACASSNVALARAGALIQSGRLDTAVIVGADLVSEFVCSGFSSLEAMSPTLARPYDKHRDGLIMGEAAGVIVLASAQTAEKYRLKPKARLSGWGMSTDALHITAPVHDGRMLANAIRQALGGTSPEEVGCVIGHGTGTRYNDEAEINALNTVFASPPPLASAKGGCGHTLGTAGIIQACMAFHILDTGILFPQTNLLEPEPAAAGMISGKMQAVKIPRILSMNSGFGGLNAVLMIEALTPS